MSKTIKELADEFGVSKTAIRKKLTEEFRSKWVETSTANGVQTLVITEEGVNALKSMLQGGNRTANLGANQPQTGLQSVKFYEEEIRELRKLLDQSQQLLLNEQKKNQFLLEEKSEEYSDKGFHQNLIESMQGSLSWNRQEVSSLNEKLENSVSKKWFYVVVSVAVVLFVMLLVLVWGSNF